MAVTLGLLYLSWVFWGLEAFVALNVSGSICWNCLPSCTWLGWVAVCELNSSSFGSSELSFLMSVSHFLSWWNVCGGISEKAWGWEYKYPVQSGASVTPHAVSSSFNTPLSESSGSRAGDTEPGSFLRWRELPKAQSALSWPSLFAVV